MCFRCYLAFFLGLCCGKVSLESRAIPSNQVVNDVEADIIISESVQTAFS